MYPTSHTHIRTFALKPFGAAFVAAELSVGWAHDVDDCTRTLC